MQTTFNFDGPRPCLTNPVQLKLDLGEIDPATRVPDELLRGIEAKLMLVGPDMVDAVFPRCNVTGNARRDLNGHMTAIETLIGRGAFPVNGEPLIFSRDGTPLDGTQRITAAHRARVPFVSWVVFGIPDERVYKMDLRTARPLKRQPVPPPSSTPWVGLADPVRAMQEWIQGSGQWHEFRMLDKAMAERLVRTTQGGGHVYLGKRSNKGQAEITADVEQGRFHLTGQPIVVGLSGRVLNGLKRCIAVALTGKPIPVLIIWDVDDGLAGTYDIGRRCTLGHRLFARSVPRGYDRAAATKTLEQIAKNDKGYEPPDSRLYDLYAKYPSLGDSVKACLPCKDYLRQSATVPLHHLFSKIDPGLAASFFRILARCVLAGPDAAQPEPDWHPVRRLHAYLHANGLLVDKGSGNTGKPVQPEVWAMIQAWNAFIGKRPRGLVLTPPVGNGFPPIRRPRKPRPA